MNLPAAKTCAAMPEHIQSGHAERFACAAESMVGTPFHLHGRDPRFGLDCVGLVAVALRIAGIGHPAIPAYGLHNRDYSFVEGLAKECGLGRAGPAIVRGDLLMVSPGPAQRHLLVATGQNLFVHAHAGLRKVVVMPGIPAWPLSNHWRIQKEQ